MLSSLAEQDLANPFSNKAWNFRILIAAFFNHGWQQCVSLASGETLLIEFSTVWWNLRRGELAQTLIEI